MMDPPTFVPRPRCPLKMASSPKQSRLRSRNAAKVIKGEIHNVLTVMRSDPRYYSTATGRTRQQSRFEFEERQHSAGRLFSRRQHSQKWQSATEGNLPSGNFYSHPILQGLRDLHDWLSAEEEVDYRGSSAINSTLNSTIGNSGGSKLYPLNAVTFVTPFAAAVCSRDVDAKTTGAALSALHKFILYGFVGGGPEEHPKAFDASGLSLTSSSEVIRESITLTARCVRHCALEETRAITPSSPDLPYKGLFSLWGNHSDQSAHKTAQTPPFHQSFDQQPLADLPQLPSFLLQQPRPESSTLPKHHAKSPPASASSSSSPATPPSFSLQHENVVLKLLSLSVQILRCPAGKTHLSSRDILGVFDTCLHVAIVAGGANNSSLLRSAAADALGHCVIVVFGTASRTRLDAFHANGAVVSNAVKEDDETLGMSGEPTTVAVSDSDDDWGDRDPTLDDGQHDFIFHNQQTALQQSTSHQSTSQQFTSQQSKLEINPMLELNESKQDGNPILEINELQNTNQSNTNTNPLNSSINQSNPNQEEPALVAIMHRLAALADPLLHDVDTSILSLTLINIALETMSDPDTLASRHPRLLHTMQNDLCRNLLRLSTADDLTVLGLTLRVIFNLFNGIKDHLKVQLEVFLTSVHLRILSSKYDGHRRMWSSSPERRELALESLLEFCREPMLMMDLYLNYDCDIKCTNLFETICSTLASAACPLVDDNTVEDPSRTNHVEEDSSTEEDNVEVVLQREWLQQPRLNILNRLALEGILAVIDSISKRCRASVNSPMMLHPFDGSSSPKLCRDDDAIPLLPSPPDSGNSQFLGNTLCIHKSTDGSLHDSSEYDFCNLSTSSEATKHNHPPPPTTTDPSKAPTSNDSIEWLSKARHRTSLALRERKLRKRRLAKAAAEFNERSRDKEWIQEAERLNVLPSPPTPKSVASFLHSAPTLDKIKMGLYLSKGPKDKYPFHGRVLEEFASMFDFKGMSFSDALRSFLSKFRLPGEAQCIDRLMEAFAARLYEVQLQSRSPLSLSSSSSRVVDAMLDPPRENCDLDKGRSLGVLDPPTEEEEEEQQSTVFPFRSADAAFILSFSTIMLNTDLHNPNMKDEKRMTLDQFIRNNRGINDGSDLPTEFLTDLYYEIKHHEIQVQKDLSDVREAAGAADATGDPFDGLLSKKASDVATPFFTADTARHTFVQAGVHERDMFVSIAAAAIRAISSVFVRSWDDALVKKALDGLKNSANICFYFGLNERFNDILEVLLGFGQDYVASVATLLYSRPLEETSRQISKETSNEISKEVLKETSKETSNEVPKEMSKNLLPDALVDNSADALADLSTDPAGLPPLPKAFLTKLNSGAAVDRVPLGPDDVAGTAAHRGLLSLDCALDLARNHLGLMNNSWPAFLEVILALRDVDALPPRLADLDDFADSRGNPLPASAFARQSQERVECYRQSLAPSEQDDSGGFWKSVFGFGGSSASKQIDRKSFFKKSHPLSETLQQVAKCAQLDQIIMKTNDIAMAKRILAAMLETMFPQGTPNEPSVDPLFEHNSVFVLELAARLLISNRARASELFPIFLAKFETLLANQSKDQNDHQKDQTDGQILGLHFPYIMERSIVTILRSCIHLYDVVEMRHQLKRSLKLIAALPPSYASTISDRLGCGAAIILRGCFYLFQDSEEWSIIGSILDMAAKDASGRKFVFDGIVSVVDYALPAAAEEHAMESGPLEQSDVQLSRDGAELLASLLLKFLDGSYENDLSLTVPAMVCIEKVYSYLKHTTHHGVSESKNANDNDNDNNPQGTEWEKIVTTIYNDVCLSNDAPTAKQGFESLQGLLLSTDLESIPDSQWFALFTLVSTNAPPLSRQESRISSLSLIAKLFLTLMPKLSRNKQNWAVLENFTHSVANLVRENLRAGRRGGVTPLFETTVHTVTNISNVMSLTGFTEDGDGVNFCGWVGETLMCELENVGACGGATSMMAAAHSRPMNQ